MTKQYRVQLPPDAYYSEWKDINIPMTEPYILGIQFNCELTYEETKEFFKDFEVAA